MNSILNKISAITIFLFIAGILFSAYFFIQMKDDILNRTTLITMVQRDEFMPVINERIAFAGLTITFGLISIILLLANQRKGGSENVVYVESFTDNKKKDSVEDIMQKDDQDDSSSEKLRDIISNINQTKESEAIEKLMSKVCSMTDAVQAAYYKATKENDVNYLEFIAGYAFTIAETDSLKFEFGEGLAGQVAVEQKFLNINNIPEGYITVLSGLGQSTPTNLVICPIVIDEVTHSVVEIATFTQISSEQENIIKETFKALVEKYKS